MDKFPWDVDSGGLESILSKFLDYGTQIRQQSWKGLTSATVLYRKVTNIKAVILIEGRLKEYREESSNFS